MMGKIAGGIGGAIAGGLVGGPVGAVLGGFGGSMLGGKDPFGNNIPNELKNPRITSYSSPGLNANFLSPQQLELTRSQEMTDALSGVSSAYRRSAGEYSALKPLVEPGFGRLTQAGINAVRDARRASMGNLRQNLARRRVLGSSFGADDIARTNAEFAKKENEFASQAFVQELALKQDLIGKEATAQANSFLTTIGQSNIESSLATQMATGVTSVLSNNAQVIADMSNSGTSALLKFGGDIAGLF